MYENSGSLPRSISPTFLITGTLDEIFQQFPRPKYTQDQMSYRNSQQL